MAITIDQAYIQTFERNLRHLAQQSVARLRPFVTEKSSNGEAHNWERLGPTNAVQKTSARTATPESDAPWSRRVSQPQTWHNGDTIEAEDIVQMLVDPKSNLAMNLAMSMRRKVDDIIITAATANALNGDGSTSAFSAGQTIGDGTGVISLDTILEVQEKYYSNDIMVTDERPVMVIGPTQQRKLMQLMEVTSGDYQNSKALATGVLPNWMGFDWVVSTRLQAPAAGQIDCLSFTRRGIGMQVNRDISAKVAEDPTKSFLWRVYTAMTLGAVRTEDEHVVRIHLKDAIS